MPTTLGKPDCETCDGDGWVSVDDDGVRRLRHCDCVRQGRQTYADGVPLEFRDARLASYRRLPGNTAAVKAAEAFLAADRGDLLLIGPVGSGKTRLACTVLNEAHVGGRRGLFLRVPKLLLELQLLFGGRSAEERHEERAFCERLFSVPLLVLDDLGVEKASDYSSRTLYTVYEERSDRGLRTIWTSNLGLAPPPTQRGRTDRPPTLGEFLGDDRLPSRLAGRAAIAYLQCADQRLPFGRGRDAD